MLKYVLSAALACTALPATAQIGDVARLEVIPGWTMPDGRQMAGLNITLAPGWKTYWRAPGDGGIPPVMSFSGSENIATARFLWPVPEVFNDNGMRSVGYMEGVVLPVEFMRSGNGPMRLSGSIQIGVCEEVCVPVTLPIDAMLPESSTRDPQLLAAVLDRPLTADEGGVSAATCRVEPISDGLQVTATVTLPHTGGEEEMIIEAGDSSIWVSEPYTTRSGAQITGMVDMVAGSGEAFALDRSAVRITILGRDAAVDVIGCSAG